MGDVENIHVLLGQGVGDGGDDANLILAGHGDDCAHKNPLAFFAKMWLGWIGTTSPLEFVQGQGKSGQKMGQEVVQLRQLIALESLQGLLSGGLELPVAGLQLLQALEVG